MYKYYKKGDYYVMYYRFDSLTEYLNHLENTEIDYRKFPNPSSIDTNSSWAGTKTYEEAVELCKYGYHENYENLINLKLQLEKYVKIDVKKGKQYNFYVGYTPDVKAYLEGHPLSMLNKELPKRKKIDIWFNSCYSSRTNKEEIYNRGAITLSLIEILEKLGYKVDLHLYDLSTCENQLFYVDYLLKQENERINCQKLYFPMCHPAWIRRLSFKLKESTPDIKEYWNYGYGKPADVSLIRKTFDLGEKDIVIAQPSEMRVYGHDIIDDANNMFKVINLSNEKGFQLEKIKKL